MRLGKQNVSNASSRGGRVESRDMVDDLGEDMWNFMSFCKKDFVKDSIPDQQLSFQDLTMRYKGNNSWVTMFQCVMWQYVDQRSWNDRPWSRPTPKRQPVWTWSFDPAVKPFSPAAAVSHLCHAVAQLTPSVRLYWESLLIFCSSRKKSPEGQKNADPVPWSRLFLFKTASEMSYLQHLSGKSPNLICRHQCNIQCSFLIVFFRTFRQMFIYVPLL